MWKQRTAYSKPHVGTPGRRPGKKVKCASRGHPHPEGGAIYKRPKRSFRGGIYATGKVSGIGIKSAYGEDNRLYGDVDDIRNVVAGR